jgi:hypothetical protein
MLQSALIMLSPKMGLKDIGKKCVLFKKWQIIFKRENKYFKKVHHLSYFKKLPLNSVTMETCRLLAKCIIIA